MKRIVAILALFGAILARAEGPLDWVNQFFSNNPTEKWDVWAYGIHLNSPGKADGVAAYGFGGGTALSYWLNPAVGAKLSLDWADSSWTLASLGMSARGTIRFGDSISVSPFVEAGPGWNVRGPAKSIVAVAGGGATVSISGLPFDIFGGYQYITTSPKEQERILFGVNFSF
jgi:hypothetical protein